MTKDENFWKTEKEITKFALLHLAELRKISPYDFHNLEPQTYDVRKTDNAVDGPIAKNSKG